MIVVDWRGALFMRTRGRASMFGVRWRFERGFRDTVAAAPPRVYVRVLWDRFNREYMLPLWFGPWKPVPELKTRELVELPRSAAQHSGDSDLVVRDAEARLAYWREQLGLR